MGVALISFVPEHAIWLVRRLDGCGVDITAEYGYVGV